MPFDANSQRSPLDQFETPIPSNLVREKTGIISTLRKMVGDYPIAALIIAAGTGGLLALGRDHVFTR